MPLPNTIGTTAAQMRDGSVISYRDADPLHIRQERIGLIFASDPLSFSVTGPDGAVFSVDLVTGELVAELERFTPKHIDTPFRLIYYKRMHGDLNRGSVMEYFVVGWQTTTNEGRNLKFGLKIYPDQHRYEVTEEI